MIENTQKLNTSDQETLDETVNDISAIKKQQTLMQQVIDTFNRMNLRDRFLFVKNIVVQNASFTMMGRILEALGTSVASANSISLVGDGNFYKVTGTTQINAISTALWQAGARVTLLFTASLTVKHNTAGATGTAKIFLAGSTDLSATNNTTLTLVFDGTQWQEISRKIP